VIGGLTLVLCTYLSTKVNVMAPGYYMTAIAIVSTLLLFASPSWLTERHGADLRHAKFRNVLSSDIINADAQSELIEMSDINAPSSTESNDRFQHDTRTNNANTNNNNNNAASGGSSGGYLNYAEHPTSDASPYEAEA
jgi:hypothetical protein